MKQECNFEIIFEKLEESKKEQEDNTGFDIDYDEMQEVNDNIKKLEKYFVEEEYIVYTQS